MISCIENSLFLYRKFPQSPEEVWPTQTRANTPVLTQAVNRRGLGEDRAPCSSALYVFHLSEVFREYWSELDSHTGSVKNARALRN